jgi:hypothetical protein
MKKLNSIMILTILSCCYTGIVLADLQITIRDKSGQISTFSNNGQQARMDDNRQPGYVLINLKTNQLNMVDPQRREVMQIDGLNKQKAMPAVNNLNIKLEKKSKGPRIAGFKTQQYDIQVNGRHCGTVFGSKKAMKKKGVEQVFKAMSSMQQQTSSMTNSFRSMMGAELDECDQADLQMNQHFKTSGVPMRILDQNGQLESEIIKFDSKAKLAPGYYVIPDNFKVTNMHQKMNEAQQQNQQNIGQMPQGMPDMNQLMLQMQKSEGMPPEAMEQMKKMREMFKQQYQGQ